jgi:putative transposase
LKEISVSKRNLIVAVIMGVVIAASILVIENWPISTDQSSSPSPSEDSLASAAAVSAVEDVFQVDYRQGKEVWLKRICEVSTPAGCTLFTAGAERMWEKYVDTKLVMKLMAEEHLTCLLRKKKYRSYHGEVGKIAPNLLRRNFKAAQPNQKWSTDITEFKLFGRKLYLSPILDLFNSEIISYAVSESPTYPIVGEMLEKAFQNLSDKASLILHSDQGWQYQMPLYQRTLLEKGIRQSISRKGNCYDNSVIENFFGVLKTEFYHNQSFLSAIPSPKF